MSSFSSFFQSSDISSWWLDKDEADDEDPFKAEENEKDCTLFLIDCNEKMFTEKLSKHEENKANEMHIKSDHDDEKISSVFHAVCNAASDALKHKIIKSKDDVVCFLLFNVLETKNAMKLSNIFLFSEPDVPSAKLIKSVRDLPLTFSSQFQSLKDGKQCDFRDLLWTLQNIFAEIDVKGTKYGSKRAFIFTNNDSPHHSDLSATKSKASDMLDAGIEIAVFPLVSNFQIKRFYGDICTFNMDELSTESQYRAVCPSLEDLKDDLRVKEMKKRSTVSCPLSIGDFHLAVKMYSLYRRATKDSPTYLDARTNQPLVTETRWICSDTGQILEDSQIKTYHEYGPAKHKIYFSKQEMREIKTFGSPSLTLMGFKPLHRLKAYYQFKPSQFVYPDEERCNGSTKAFDALIRAMHKEKVFAVCMYIARKASIPRFVALVAQQELLDKEDNNRQIQPPGLNMIFLPFADDIRKVDVDGLEHMKRVEPTRNAQHAQLVTKCKAMIKRLRLDRHPDDEEVDPDLEREADAMELEFPCNPQLQTHYDALELLALEQGGDADDAQQEQVVKDEIKMDEATMDEYARKEMEEYMAALQALDDVDFDGGDVAESKPRASRKRKAEDGNEGSKKRKAAKRKATDSTSSDTFDWKKLAENDELKSLKVKDLKIYLNENGLKLSGKKADLIERIKDHLGVE
eukprot:CAMPEP_0197030270 /NCGR_PEP_ID=MMETSP1384-20130603/9537_1 /TAXON_ID=29189 /ORGANISM="Ammonia sp." /LENGTH=685 /DNA_ID=CAMNT_0042459585 /DNA_START=33 /DNA_END=2090 /DNA_ORIENTATION=-